MKNLSDLCYVLVIVGSASANIHWHYGDEETWPEICKNGKKQSPISLNRHKSSSKEFAPFVLTNYDKIHPATLKNNGHSIEAKLHIADALTVTVNGGGLPETYILDNVHFHWESEHIIDNYRYPLEMHLVHYGQSYGNVSNAILYEQGIAVLSVLCDLSPDDNVEFVPFLETGDHLKNNVNFEEKLYHFRLLDYIPKDTAGYYRYEGSLTTPNCNEAVIWTVFTNTIPISQNQLLTFESMETEEHTALKKNYRPLQKLNNRHVFLKQSPLHRGSCTRIVSLLSSWPGRTISIFYFVSKFL